MRASTRAPRSGHWETDAAGEHSVLVEAVSDLLITLTVPRREKDGDQVRELRRIQQPRSPTGSSLKPRAYMDGLKPVWMIGSCAAS